MCIHQITGSYHSLRQQEKYISAIQAYQQALTIDPQQIAAYNGISYAYIKLKDYEEALNYNKKGLSLNSQSASAYNCKGIILKYQERYTEALEAFMLAIELAEVEDNLAGYYYNISVVLAKIDSTEEAIDACEISKLLEPVKYDEQLSRLCKRSSLQQKNTFVLKYVKKRVSLFISSAKLLYKCGKYELVLTLLEKAYPIDPNQLSSYIEKGNIYLALQEYKDALYAFNEVFFVCPNDISALLGKARALHYLEQYDRAIGTYNLALWIDSNLMEAIVGKGHSYFSSGKSIDALKAYADAMNAGTQDVSCYSNVGDLLMDCGDYTQALKMYDTALHITPQYVPALKGQAKAFFKVKNYQAALSAYQNLHDLDPEDVLIKLGLEEISVSKLALKMQIH